MSNSVIGALRVNLGLDAAQFQRGVAGAQASMQSLASRMRMIGAAAAAAGVGLALAVRGQINAADEMVKTADRIGMSVEALSQLEHAASLSGVSMQTFSGAMQRLARTSVESAGELHRLGVATRDSSGQMRPMEAILMDVADRLAAMPPGAERTALAIQLLGRQGAELIPMLQGGSAGLRTMMAEADSLGLTLSNRTARAAEAFNDNVSRLGRQITGLTRMLMAELAPALAAISNGIVAAVGRFRAMSAAVGGFQGFIIAGAVAITAAYVPAIYSAVTATAAWIASLITLRGALIATGIGAFVVLAGTAINWLIRLREQTGSWGEAFGLLGDVISGVFQGMIASARAVPLGLQVVWNGIQRGFVGLLFELSLMWRRFLSSLANSLPEAGAFGGIFDGVRDGIRAATLESDAFRRGLNATSRDLRASGDAARQSWDSARTGAFEPAREAIARLREAMGGSREETDATAEAMGALRTALDAAGGATGAGGARGAASATDELTEAQRRLQEASRSVESSFESAFVGLVSGTRSARDAVAGLLQDLARLAAQAAFRSLFSGSSFFAGLGSIFGGFRAAGGPVSAGRAYVVGERGPELFVPQAGGSIVPNHAMGGGGSSVTINIDARGAVEGTAAQIDAMLARRLPDIQRAAASYTVDRLNRGMTP